LNAVYDVKKGQNKNDEEQSLKSQATSQTVEDEPKRGQSAPVISAPKAAVSSAPEQATPSPVAQPVSSFNEYYQYLYKIIAGAVVKPKVSTAGTIKVAFTLRSNGVVESIKFLEGSSQNSFLRIAVARAINESSPFSSFPNDMKNENSKTFTMEIEFK
jgi:TonB family protein